MTPDSPLALLRAARARVDLDRLAANYDAICGVAGLPVMPVVKADAYGHGAARCRAKYDTANSRDLRDTSASALAVTIAPRPRFAVASWLALLNG